MTDEEKYEREQAYQGIWGEMLGTRAARGYAIACVASFGALGALVGLRGATHAGGEAILGASHAFGVGLALGLGLLGVVVGLLIPQNRWFKRLALALGLTVGLALVGLLQGSFWGLLLAGIETGIVYTTGGWVGGFIPALVGAASGGILGVSVVLLGHRRGPRPHSIERRAP